MSIETTLARAAARDAAAKWKAHRLNCPKCVHVRVGPGGPGPCRAGSVLFLVHMAARNELARNRELDKQVPEGQAALF